MPSWSRIAIVLPLAASAWRVCDVTSPDFGALGDGVTDDTAAIRKALINCNEVLLPAGASFLSGPVNLTSNQMLRVDGTFLASQEKTDYPIVPPVLGYGWSNDGNCFAPGSEPHRVVEGALRYAPVIGAFYAKNVSVVGSGTIDGQGDPWYSNCTKCHYTPGNDSSFCLTVSRPKLLEFQFVDGLVVRGASVGEALTLQNSPFWTLTPSYTQNIHVKDLRIFAPMNKIGNTDGCNMDSCRNALIENLYIQNSDDGVCVKSGLQEYGFNLGIPTENVLVRNITCPKGGRGGFAIGSEISGGIRNVTFRDSILHGERGINIKPSIGRGGYIRDMLFENITMTSSISLHVGGPATPWLPGNNYVPLVDSLHFSNIEGSGGCRISCSGVNGSACHRMRFSGTQGEKCKCDSCDTFEPKPRYTCKTTANTQFAGTIQLPWGVCLPSDSPVNVNSDFPNWGPTDGDFETLEACQSVCVLGHAPFPSSAVV